MTLLKCIPTVPMRVVKAIVKNCLAKGRGNHVMIAQEDSAAFESVSENAVMSDGVEGGNFGTGTLSFPSRAFLKCRGRCEDSKFQVLSYEFQVQPPAEAMTSRPASASASRLRRAELGSQKWELRTLHAAPLPLNPL